MKLNALRSGILCLVLQAAASVSAAQPEPVPGLDNICSAVRFRLEDEAEGSRYRFEYQRMIVEAAGAEAEFLAGDHQGVGKKIRALWQKYSARLVCNAPSFELEDGSVNKLAVAFGNDEYVYDISLWKMGLNDVDPRSGTLLDYVNGKIDRSKGTPLEQKFQRYYARLAKAGAKRRSELP